MLVVLGLIILLVAVIVGLAGVLGNAGSEHALTDGFAFFGIEVNGSTGTLFLIGIVVGVAAVLGLGMLLAGARRTAVRRSGRGRSVTPDRPWSRRLPVVTRLDHRSPCFHGRSRRQETLAGGLASRVAPARSRRSV